MRINLQNNYAIKLISYVYLLNAILFSFSLLIFYSYILLFGHPVSKILSHLINASLISVSLYLFIRFGRLKRDAFWLALLFHFFFILNGASSFLENFFPSLHPPLRIVGIFGTRDYSLAQLVVIALNIILNFLILLCIINKRALFFTTGD